MRKLYFIFIISISCSSTLVPRLREVALVGGEVGFMFDMSIWIKVLFCTLWVDIRNRCISVTMTFPSIYIANACSNLEGFALSA